PIGWRALTSGEEEPPEGRLGERPEVALPMQGQAKPRQALDQDGNIRHVEAQEGRTVSILQPAVILRCKRVGGHERRNQLDLRPIWELHVSVAQPVVVWPARLEGEAESLEVGL